MVKLKTRQVGRQTFDGIIILDKSELPDVSETEAVCLYGDHTIGKLHHRTVGVGDTVEDLRPVKERDDQLSCLHFTMKCQQHNNQV